MEEDQYKLTIDIRDGVYEVSRQMLVRALELTLHNRTHTARILKVHLRTVRNHIKEYKIESARELKEFEPPWTMRCTDCDKPVKKNAPNAEFGKCFMCLNNK